MRIEVITLFPDFVEGFFETGIIGKAKEAGKLDVTVTNLRSFAINDYGQVDDTPYGGGSGMVLRPETAAAAISAARERSPNAKVILLSPRGTTFTQDVAQSLVASSPDNTPAISDFIFLCCRYEGVDERVISLVDEEISLGDFVMMGGEVAAMAILEATIRLVPDILGNPESTQSESFSDALLEYPQYTKPQDFEGRSVPDILLSGDHRKIQEWRREQSEKITLERRPDLLQKKQHAGELSVALLHYPVYNKQKEIITSSITNIDVHDIARSSRTYGLERYYVIHPTKALRRLVNKISEHWETGYGATYNPNRGEALSKVTLLPTFEDMISDIEQRTGKLPRLIGTSARRGPKTISFVEMRARLVLDETPHLLLLGTGWGLAEEITSRCDYFLEPINGPTDYNHLSVRAAAAILLDRLRG